MKDVRKKILVVDDTIGIRTFLKITLENSGYDVVEKDDGYSALEAFQSEKPDLVVLDLGLPDIDGMEVLQKIRETDTQTPIVILTVRSEESSVKKAFQIGANGYITKPFQIDEILEKAEELVN